MTIIDDGVKRRVDSGFIDVTARDSSGEIVVIELKAGVAGPQAITQALSYMGGVLAEEEGCKTDICRTTPTRRSLSLHGSKATRKP